MRSGLKSLQTVVERFWTKVDQSGGPDACWPWTGSLTDGGYGQFRFLRKIVKAHRFAWAVAKNGGNLPPQNVDIHHNCESRYTVKRLSRRCCNPDHLFAVEGAIHDAMHQKERKRK
jgi:hypothetical protein